jgi:hypothetical protein
VLAHRPKSLLHDPFEEAPEDLKIAAFPDAGPSFTGGPEVVMRTSCSRRVRFSMGCYIHSTKFGE